MSIIFTIKIVLILLLVNSILYLNLVNSKPQELFDSHEKELNFELKPISEMFGTYHFLTPLECKDYLKIKFLNLNEIDKQDFSKYSQKTQNKLDNECDSICKVNNTNPINDYCNPNICLYKKLDDQIPAIIHTASLESIEKYDNNNNTTFKKATISWFKPESANPILKYILVIDQENNLFNYEASRIEILRNDDDNDFVRHTIMDLKLNTKYYIKILAENKHGRSKPYKIEVNTDTEFTTGDSQGTTTTPKSNQTRIIKQLEEIDKYYEDITKILQNKPVIELI